MSNQIINLELPALHPAQLKITQEAKRYNVVCCGRRWGKTLLGMDRVIHPALNGQPVAWFSPSNKIQAETWRELRSRLESVTVNKSEQEKRLELVTGGSIELWSLDGPDAGRGRKYAVVVIDEAAMIPHLEEAWQQSIRPTLTDVHGSAWFLSTPKGMNYFKALFDRGQDSQRDEWMSWQMLTVENPFIDPGEIEAARLDITEAAFNQEYLALFVNWDGSVFRKVGDAATATAKLQPEEGHEYVIGCDWGRSNDCTVFVVLDLTTREMVAIDRSNRVDYAVQRGRLRALYERWHPKQVIAEQNSIGQPVIEQLTRDGLRVQPFTTTNASKALAIEALALAFERGAIHILNDAVLVSELVAYQAEKLPSGVRRYGAPAGQHDDCVMALAIGWTAVDGQHRAVYSVPESDLIVEPFEIPYYWPRAYGLELRHDSVAAIWGARNPENDTIYLYDEYLSTDADPCVHGREIGRRGRWMRGVTDPAANGRNSSDGYRIIQMYRDDMKLKLESTDKLIESGILAVRQRMTRGKLKVFSSLTHYLEQLRYYGRDAGGHVVTGNDQLQNAARYLVVAGVPHMRTDPAKDELANFPRCYAPKPVSEGDWMRF